jgi:hypothetical protein
MGDFLPPNGTVAWRASADAPADGASMRLVCDGRVVSEASANTVLKFEHPAGGVRPGACRVEIGWDHQGRRTLWIVTNPIYLRSSDPPVIPPILPRAAEAWRLPAGSIAPWIVEKDEQSEGRLAWEDAIGPEPSGVRLDFTLRDGQRQGQFVALATTRIDGLTRATRVRFHASASRPMRVSFQLREPSGAAGRWVRAVYVDQTPRDYAVSWDDLRPAAAGQAPHPPLDRIHALLFVIDTVHTVPGTAGALRLSDVQFERAP